MDNLKTFFEYIVLILPFITFCFYGYKKSKKPFVIFYLMTLVCYFIYTIILLKQNVLIFQDPTAFISISPIFLIVTNFISLMLIVFGLFHLINRYNKDLDKNATNTMLIITIILFIISYLLPLVNMWIL